MIREWIGSADSCLNQNQIKKKRICFFSHYDRDGKIDDYVLYYLKCLKECGLDLIFITTSDQELDEEIKRVLPYCVLAIQRKNITLDFGSWRIAWDRATHLLEMKMHYNQLVLANDSVYGPFFSLPQIFSEMELKNLDFWGMSSSEEITDHLQSYFLVFEQKVFHSQTFEKFWTNFIFYRRKSTIIRKYEIGLSRLAIAEDWRRGAWFQIESESKFDVNPTLFSWDDLIQRHKFPFLKTEVLRLNRARSKNVNCWEKIVSKSSEYPISLIKNHVTRVRQ
ncbi:MAG: rhamnan synthesis F family protein [Bdellovibrionia bacterium]